MIDAEELNREQREQLVADILSKLDMNESEIMESWNRRLYDEQETMNILTDRNCESERRSSQEWKKTYMDIKGIIEKHQGVPVHARSFKISDVSEEPVQLKGSADESKDLFIEDYKKGLSIQKIAKKYGCSFSVVRYHLDKAGIIKEMADKKKKEKSERENGLNEKIVQEYQSNMSLKQIGEKHGISTYKVHGILKAQGVERRPPTGANKEKCEKIPSDGDSANGKEKINAYIKASSLCAEIAELYSSGYRTVSVVINESEVSVSITGDGWSATATEFKE